MIRRPPRSTPLYSSAASDVYKRQLHQIGDAILRLNKERGYTFCIIEHDMQFIARLCNPVIVMAQGRILAEGSATQVQANEDVIDAYLGTGLKNQSRKPRDHQQ